MVARIVITVSVFAAAWTAWDLVRGRPFELGNMIIGAVIGAIVAVFAVLDERRQAREKPADPPPDFRR